MSINSSNLEAFKARVFSKKNGEHNVIIQGVGIENIIINPQTLLQKIIKNSSVGRVEAFRRKTNQIEFRIKGTYAITNTSTDILNIITSFTDLKNNILTLNNGGLTNAFNLENLSVNGLTSFGGGGTPKISNTKLKTLNLPSMVLLNGNNSIVNNLLLETFNAEILTSIINYRGLSGNSELKLVNCKKLKTMGTGDVAFEGSGKMDECVFKVHIFSETNNNLRITGDKYVFDKSLDNPFFDRGAKVEFYNDAQVFVKNLSFTPNVTIKGGLNVNTNAKLRSKITGLRFSDLTYVDNNVTFYLNAYTLFNGTFSGDTSITEFIDNSGLIIGSSTTSFTTVFRNALNFKKFQVPSIKYLGNYVFENTQVEELILNSLIGIGNSTFYGMPKLRYVETLSLVTVANSNTQMANCPLLEEFNAPNITTLGDAFYQNDISLKKAIHNKIVIQNAGRVFNNCQSIELIEMKRCISLGDNLTDNNIFTDIKLGCQIHVNIALKTINAGDLNPNLKYAKTVRNAVIHFYDDELNLIETI